MRFVALSSIPGADSGVLAGNLERATASPLRYAGMMAAAMVTVA